MFGREKDCAGACAVARGTNGGKDCACAAGERFGSGCVCGLAVGACGINARRGNRRRPGEMKKPRGVRGLLRFCKFVPVIF